MTNKLILGTVQLGMPYGINNNSGQPSNEQTKKILQKAWDDGIRILDTADSYGNSQALIGEFHKENPNSLFEIATKFGADSKLIPIRKHIDSLLEKLNVAHIGAYMFHNITEYRNRKHEIEKIKDYRENGIVREIGIAVYTNEEIEYVIADGIVDMIQLPYNLLDNKIIRGACIEKAKKAGITIQARSVYLQGLFFKDPDCLGEKFEDFAAPIRSLAEIASNANRSIGELALKYVCQNPEIDQVLIGVETLAQLEQNSTWNLAPALDNEVIDQIENLSFGNHPLLNPANWNIETLIITQARTGSSRLPGKILKEAGGKSLLQIHIDRIKQAELGDALLIATTTSEGDDVIPPIAYRSDVLCFRGSEDDVLDRFYKAAKPFRPKTIVRLTSDCPLIDPKLIDLVINHFKNDNDDYCSNSIDQTFPDGESVEVFKFSALERAWNEAKLKSEREHVTPYIYKNGTHLGKTLFKVSGPSNDENLEHVRITVDEPEDLKVIRLLVDALGLDATWEEYTKLYLERPDIHSLNSDITRNEGYIKSLIQDKK